MKIKAAAVFTALVCAGTVHASGIKCSLANSEYSLSSHRDVTAEFVPYGDSAASRRAALKVSIPDRQPYWFLVDKGAYLYPVLISTTDVTSSDWEMPDPDTARSLPDMDLYAWSDDYQFAGDMVHADSAAPTTLLIPRLLELVRHAPDAPVDLGLGVFELQRCVDSPQFNARLD